MSQSTDSHADINKAAETADALMAAVDKANDTLRTYLDNTGGGETNYFKSMEWMLSNYYELAQLVADASLYMDEAKRERSKSLVTYRGNGGGMPSEDAEEAAEQLRAKHFAYTKARFDEINGVVRVYADRKEMRVVRMYYFREDADGNRIAVDEKRMTFEEIAVALGNDEKTVRRWRSRIVNDMAVTLFGKRAAIEAGTYRKARQGGGA
jgi:hypothetical protein